MSSVYLYKDCKVIPEKNFVVEGLESYLSGLTSISIANFQYQRNDLNLTIKIDKSQIYTESLSTYNYNYLKIVQNGVNYYYFIMKKTQVAESTIALELLMDVLNTYKWGDHFTPSATTKALRQHKNRYAKNFKTTHFSETIEDREIEKVITLLSGPFPYHINSPVSQYQIKNVVMPHFPEGDYTYEIFTQKVGATYYLKVRFTLSEEVQHSESLDFDFVQRYFKPVVDLYSEGINPTLYKEEISVLDNSVPYHWYLIYKTNQFATPEDPQVVNCFLCADREIEVKASDTIILHELDIGSGKVLCFQEGSTLGHERNRVKAVFDGISISTGTYYANIWALQMYGFVIDKDPNHSGKLRLRTYIWEIVEAEGFPPVYNNYLQTTYDNISEIILESENDTITCHEGTSIPYYNGLTQNKTFTKTDNSVLLKAFENIDRTESTLIKIFALPYLPSNYNLDSNGVIVFGNEWEYDSVNDLMKLKNLNTKFESLIETNVPDLVYEALFPRYIESDPDSDRTTKDNKLFHSDYYLPKFVYDSFSFPFEIEKIGDNEYTQVNFKFSFVMTSTIKSRFLFKFDAYNPQFATEDYHNILNINRNNEAVIYNSEYLTYLRTGYNIDIKAKERTQTTAIIGGVLSTIGSISSAGVGLNSDNKGLAVNSIIRAGTSLAGTIVSTINTIAQSEENIERRLATLKSQAVSVEGSDDLDLLENYSNNKAKMVLYKVSPKIEKSLDDLFYYTGYISEEVGVPNVNTRYWFNYLSCELKFSGISKNISESAKSALVARYQDGVIFLHNHSSAWCFGLNKENWENIIMED